MRSVTSFVSAFVVTLSILTAPVLAELASEQASTHESSGKRGILSPAWGIRVQEDLVAQEYWISWQDQTPLNDVTAAWQAPNRAQGFRTYFTPSGMHVVPRTAESPRWQWGLALASYGRGSIAHPLEPARLFPDENRIRLDRREIDEWFVNEPQGLKHGFILHAPPDEDHEPTEHGRAVHLDLTVDGSLTPVLGADGHSARFMSTSGLAVVYYQGLEVQDALGRSLPAWMEVDAASGAWTIRLLIDDREAVYPIEIDPLATTAAWTAEIDQEGSGFGFSVATAGDVNADGYDDVIVGAQNYDHGEVNEGAAFLYLGSAQGLSTVKDWMVESDEAVANAGASVATAGDVNADGYDDVIVGVSGLNNGGGAWVFHGSSTGLSLEADWAVQCDQPNNSAFGRKVGTAGDVNADGYDDVIVGAILYDSPGLLQDGRAFVYHGSSSGLSTDPAWITAGNQSNANYGIGVGTAGDVNNDGYDDVIVSANGFDNGETDEGRAYVYHGSATGLSIDPDWIYENNEVQSCLGTRLGTAGDVNNDGYDDVIIGAANRSCVNAPTSPWGRAYEFHGSASGLSSVPDWTVELVQTGALFGSAVATAGDVNADGYDDVVVGAMSYDSDENEYTDEGAVFLYLGSAAGLSIHHAWMVEGNQTDSRSGFAAATAGDVDADGYDDVVVGAWKYDNPELDEGAAFLYLGGPELPAGWVPDDTPLLIRKRGSHWIELSWGASCLGSDSDYEIYAGQLGDFTSHEPVLCSTDGDTTMVLDPDDGDLYYLIVPRSAGREGSYGTTSDGVTQRPQGSPACFAQAIGDC